jgi:hypothetical protein
MSTPKSPPARPDASPDPEPAGRDVALVHRVEPDGSVHVIRRRGDSLEAGALRPVVEGAPLQGELVALRPREDFPLLCDVDVLYKPPATDRAAEAEAKAPRDARRKGPAQVASDVYRENWDTIWNNKKPSELN